MSRSSPSANTLELQRMRDMLSPNSPAASLLLGFEIPLQQARPLRRHAVRRRIAPGQLEGDAKRRVSGAGAARMLALAPVVAEGHHVKAVDDLPGGVVMQVA